MYFSWIDLTTQVGKRFELSTFFAFSSSGTIRRYEHDCVSFPHVDSYYRSQFL